MYEKIKKYYDAGVWDEDRVRAAVMKGVIIADEFHKITGHGIIDNNDGVK